MLGRSEVLRLTKRLLGRRVRLVRCADPLSARCEPAPRVSSGS